MPIRKSVQPQKAVEPNHVPHAHTPTAKIDNVQTSIVNKNTVIGKRRQLMEEEMLRKAV